MKRTISIMGPIGSFDYLDEKTGKVVHVNGIQIADVVAQVASLPEKTTELEILMGTPGGLIPIGEAIYAYLKSLRYKITMLQVDDIASIGTVVWFAGKDRLAAEGINPRTGKKYLFQPHNPWKPHTQGDAAAHEAEAVRLRQQETKMAAFYQEHTGLDSAAILPIMKADAPFDAEKAVALKFATATYEPLKQAAFQLNQPMKPEEKSSLFKGFLSLLGMDDAPGATPPPAPAGDLMNKPVLIDGKAPLDGVYTVKGGVVTAITPLPAAAPAAGQAPAPAAPAAAAPVSFNQEKFSEALAATIEKALETQKKDFEAQIVALKKQVKTSHVPAGPEGYNPSTKAEDVKEYNELHKSGELLALKKSDPDKYQRLHFSRYGVMPNM